MKFILLVTMMLCNVVQAFDSPKALQDAFMTALRSNDVEGMAACYTADATNFAPDTLMGIGPASVRASWGGFFQSFHVSAAELTEEHMEISGDLAVAWGLYTITAQPQAGGESVVMQGRYMDAARNFDGNWLYIADHASMPLPPSED